MEQPPCAEMELTALASTEAVRVPTTVELQSGFDLVVFLSTVGA
jgi:hypothetical protein